MAARQVFQIGFNRCATRALAGLFARSGYRSVHWARGALARDLEAAAWEGGRPLASWHDVRFFSDMTYTDYRNGRRIEGNRHFALLDLWFPDAVFLLNTRFRGDWLTSRMLHRRGRYLRAHARHFGTGDPRHVLDRWAWDWECQHAAVRRHFAGREGKLVEFHIDKDPVEKLIEELAPDFQLDPGCFHVLGATSRQMAQRAA